LSHCLLRPLDIFCRPIHQPPWVYWLDITKCKWTNHLILCRCMVGQIHTPLRTLVYYMCIQWSWSMTSIFVLALKSLPSLYRNAPPGQGGVAQGWTPPRQRVVLLNRICLRWKQKLDPTTHTDGRTA
jgi:hypothetical protein